MKTFFKISLEKFFFIKTWNVTECMEPTLGHEQSVTIFWWTWSMSHGHDHNWARCQIGVNCITLYRVKLGQSGDTGFVSVFSIFFEIHVGTRSSILTF